MFFSAAARERRNTLAISSSLGSVLRIPSRTFDQTSGSTIRKAINMERFELLIHTRARITNEATGVALIIFIGSSKKAQSNRERALAKAMAAPRNSPTETPP